MSDDAQINLEYSFQKLDAWVEESSDEIIGCDVLVAICLEIIDHLVDDQDLIQQISQKLSLIVALPAKTTAEEDLHQSLLFLEQDLEEHLRGFSNLFDVIVQEEKIRRDPHTMLKDMAAHESVKEAFVVTSHSLFAYGELTEAFEPDAPYVAVGLFLKMLTNIFAHLCQKSAPQAHNIIASWLRMRVKSHQLSSFYEDIHDTEIAFVQPLSKDKVLMFICERASLNKSFTKQEARILDDALKAFDMFGLEPLLASGFVSIEQDDKKSFRSGDVVHLYKR